MLAKRYLAAQTFSSRCELNQHVQKSVTASVRGRERSQSVATRTSDGKPICFNCHKPGHLALHCRSFDNKGRNRGRSTDRFNSGRKGGNRNTTWSRNCSNSYNNNGDYFSNSSNNNGGNSNNGGYSNNGGRSNSGGRQSLVNGLSGNFKGQQRESSNQISNKIECVVHRQGQCQH